MKYSNFSDDADGVLYGIIGNARRSRIYLGWMERGESLFGPAKRPREKVGGGARGSTSENSRWDPRTVQAKMAKLGPRN